jgi:hypothetical protein
MVRTATFTGLIGWVVSIRPPGERTGAFMGGLLAGAI